MKNDAILDEKELQEFSDESEEPIIFLERTNKKEARILSKLSRWVLKKEDLNFRSRHELYPKLEELIMDIHQNPPEGIDYIDQYDKYGIIPLMVKQPWDAPRVIFGVRATKQNSKKLRRFQGFKIALEEEIYPYDNINKKAEREYILLSEIDFEELKKYAKDKIEREKLLDIVKIGENIETRATYQDLLRVAIKHEASDIHIEPIDDEKSEIRLRIDGVLRKLGDIVGENKFKGLDKQIKKELVQIIKTDSEMDISEKRRPQDGRLYVEGTKGRLYNIRVSSINTNHGEKIVMRIMNQETSFSLEQLGYPTKIYNDIKNLVATPSGIILITGPTGSGKTTTLYSILQERNTPEVNIMTVENPIEIDLEGINQTQYNPDIGYDFANALRTFLRQDPDIILVGEIRDKETAEVATQASRTGHLVLSTIHADDSIEALLRFKDFGIDKRDLASCLKGIISQRLTRKLCEKCRSKYPGHRELQEMFGEEVTKEKIGFFKKTGQIQERPCSYCEGTGYKGRTVVPELWILGDEEREMIHAGNTNHEDYIKVALNKGMWDLTYSGLRLILTGKTSIDEIFRVAVDKHRFLSRNEYVSQSISRIIKEFKDKNTPGDTTIP